MAKSLAEQLAGLKAPRASEEDSKRTKEHTKIKSSLLTANLSQLLTMLQSESYREEIARLTGHKRAAILRIIQEHEPEIASDIRKLIVKKGLYR
jgi:hypothetical protein